MADETETEMEGLLGRVNARTVELSDEFRQFTRDIKAKIPEFDDRDAFEGWAIQKLSGLQITMEVFTEELHALRIVATNRH